MKAISTVLSGLGMAIVGFLAGGVLFGCAFSWAVYGMGHTQHSCNLVGMGMMIALPALGFGAAVYTSVQANGFLSGDDDPGDPWVRESRRLARRIPAPLAGKLCPFFAGFMFGPLAFICINGIFYSVGFIPPL